jgi:hypothetical protein
MVKALQDNRDSRFGKAFLKVPVRRAIFIFPAGGVRFRDWGGFCRPEAVGALSGVFPDFEKTR